MAGRRGHFGARCYRTAPSARGGRRSEGVMSLKRSAAPCLALVFLLGTTLAAADHPSSVNPTSNVVAGANGEALYSHICQGCHMPGGQGAVGAGHYPKLAGDPALVSWQYVAMTVLNGKNGMPGFGLPADQFIFGAARLSDAQ